MNKKSRHSSKQNLNYMKNRYNTPYDINYNDGRIIEDNRNNYSKVRKVVRWGIYILHKLDDYMQLRFYHWYY